MKPCGVQVLAHRAASTSWRSRRFALHARPAEVEVAVAQPHRPRSTRLVVVDRERRRARRRSARGARRPTISIAPGRQLGVHGLGRARRDACRARRPRTRGAPRPPRVRGRAVARDRSTTCTSPVRSRRSMKMHAAVVAPRVHPAADGDRAARRRPARSVPAQVGAPPVAERFDLEAHASLPSERRARARASSAPGASSGERLTAVACRAQVADGRAAGAQLVLADDHRERARRAGRRARRAPSGSGPPARARRRGPRRGAASRAASAGASAARGERQDDDAGPGAAALARRRDHREPLEAEREADARRAPGRRARRRGRRSVRRRRPRSARRALRRRPRTPSARSSRGRAPGAGSARSGRPRCVEQRAHPVEVRAARRRRGCPSIERGVRHRPARQPSSLQSSRRSGFRSRRRWQSAQSASRCARPKARRRSR